MAGIRVSLNSGSTYPEFTRIMSEFGEKYHLVGFPTEGGNGNYWKADYYLVMSKDAAHKEELKEFIASVYEPERQRGTAHPVRNDLSALYTVNFDGRWSYNAGNGIYYPLEGKADGSSWEEEYQATLNQCVARSANMGSIVTIISEETASYFSGSRDVQKTVETIQNRVQLYLDEQGR